MCFALVCLALVCLARVCLIRVCLIRVCLIRCVLLGCDLPESILEYTRVAARGSILIVSSKVIVLQRGKRAQLWRPRGVPREWSSPD